MRRPSCLASVAAATASVLASAIASAMLLSSLDGRTSLLEQPASNPFVQDPHCRGLSHAPFIRMPRGRGKCNGRGEKLHSGANVPGARPPLPSALQPSRLRHAELCRQWHPSPPLSPACLRSRRGAPSSRQGSARQMFKCIYLYKEIYLCIYVYICDNGPRDEASHQWASRVACHTLFCCPLLPSRASCLLL